MFNVEKNDGNTLQADGLDHRGFHLSHHILIKERTLYIDLFPKLRGNIMKGNID